MNRHKLARLISRLMLCLCCVGATAVLSDVAAGESVTSRIEQITDTVLYVPHLVMGTAAGAEYSTTVTVSNPYQETTLVRIFVQWDGALSGTDEELELGSGFTHTLEYVAGPNEWLKGGWMEIHSETPVAVLAHITGRSAAGEVIANVSVPGVEPRSKFVIPVLRNDPLADNTGVAIVSPLGGLISAELRDQDGNLVATRDLVAASDGCAPNNDPFIRPPICSLAPPDFFFRDAILLQELFDGLPADFHSGLLVLEHKSYLGSDESYVGPQYPFGMSVLALYTSGLDLSSATGIVLDIPVRFEVVIPSNIDGQHLASQYDIDVVRQEIDGNSRSSLFVESTVATAKVLSKNPDVLKVRYNPTELDPVVSP